MLGSSIQLGASNILNNMFLPHTGALAADGDWEGIYCDGTAGATLTFGQLCYLAAADSRWELTDADAESTAGPLKLGICILAAASDGSATRMLLWGNVRADSAFPTLTISAPAYVGTTTGAIQTTAPSGANDIVRVVGYGNTANELFFCPSSEYRLNYTLTGISVSLADDATTTLTDATEGYCVIHCNGEMTSFHFYSDGTIVEATNGTANIDYADTDAKLCVYASGTQVVIKNRLGATYSAKGYVVYLP